GYDNPDVILLQWLRACKWDVKAAIHKIMDLLKWRIEWGVQALLANGESEISLEEAAIGKGYFMGHDKAGRPICYIHARDHIRGQFSQKNTEKLTILAAEMCRKLLEPPVETITIVVDIAELGMENVDLQVANMFISLLESYYPELLGLGIVLNSSYMFGSCWTVIKPWLDPVIESKIRFINNEADLAEYIDPSNIPQRLHGNHHNFQYIFPSAEDKAMIAAFRADHQGKTTAQAVHREAARNHLNVTLRWAHHDDNQNLLAERANATKQLQDAFEKLLPYITTRMHYHRTGDINEPIFNIAYEKLCASDKDSVLLK
ncbi:unnamed protein product, partial [Rotaria sp. Silwood2]